jgi:general secretion pathway protein E
VEIDCDPQAWQDLTAPWKAPMPAKVFSPKGCLECRDTGYLGRVGLYEIMLLSNDLKKKISENLALGDLKNQAWREGLLPLRLAGAQKVSAGQTTMEEVMRVAPLT